ncbi:hypothetical protein [Pseudanabaena sp. 'Roaring Creek']|uniref:hypothetical protein n=1 Tax=Pseudanabaena sp. 'Roaring Creek' TaxID=1681830 RepID=UPI0006D85198|nr:hypothetical protein [Pseudanabaena sp. 'Roaring Creek']
MKVSALVLLASTVIGTVAFNPAIASAGEVYNRLERQQDRIDSGLKDGQLTTQEATRLQNRDASINQQRINDLKQNGGHLTNQEYRQLNREENGVSRAIYRERHD